MNALTIIGLLAACFVVMLVIRFTMQRRSERRWVKRARALDKETEDMLSHAEAELDEMFPQSKEEKLVQEAVDTIFQNEEQRQAETLGKMFQAMRAGYRVRFRQSFG